MACGSDLRHGAGLLGEWKGAFLLHQTSEQKQTWKSNEEASGQDHSDQVKGHCNCIT